MKFKFKLLATAAALALSSASAFATIDVSTDPSLIFIAYDGSGNTSQTYYRILGSLSSIGNTNVTFSAPTNSIFSTQLAGIAPSNINWNVFALDNVNPIVYITGQSVPALNSQNLNLPFDVVSAAGILTNELGGITQLDNPAKGYAKPNNEYAPSTDPSDQTNAYTMVTNFEFALFGSAKGVGSSQNFDTVSGVDGSISQLYTNSALSAFNGDAKGGYFTLASAGGDVTWTGTAAVSAVPLPAAGLLLAPGLMGMLGLGRRRNKQA